MGGALAEVDERLAQILSGRSVAAREPMGHILGSGGKRLRPLLTLLSARAVGREEADAIPCAVAAELVHSATLLHDDVMDDGRVRRGLPAARVLYGNTLAVLAGDLLMVTALREAERGGVPGALGELLDTVTRMVEGEVLQLQHRGSFSMDRATYERIIIDKTASLFAWCTRTGARAGGATPGEERGLSRFGHHVGMAFQIRDDMLDLIGDPRRTGKALGADLAEGKLTLPVLVALERRPGLLPQVRALAEAGGDRSAASIACLIRALRETGSLARCHQELNQHRRLAMDALRAARPGPVVELFGSVTEALSFREG